jgi:hypothetical protein
VDNGVALMTPSDDGSLSSRQISRASMLHVTAITTRRQVSGPVDASPAGLRQSPPDVRFHVGPIAQDVDAPGAGRFITA